MTQIIRITPDELTSARAKRKISRAEAATRISTALGLTVSERAVRQWESGASPLPDRVTVEMLDEVIG
jgi:DNA-binding transcriptional regulator YiaG